MAKLSKKERGYWNVKENCIECVKLHKNISSLIKENGACYASLVKNGWLDEVQREIFKKVEKLYDVYAFIMEHNKTCYITKSSNLNKTKEYHRLTHKKNGKLYTTEFHDFYVKENNGIMPEPLALYKSLSKDEADIKVYFEVQKYKKSGWKCLGENSIKLPQTYWDYFDNCQNVAINYRGKKELFYEQRHCYYGCVRNNFFEHIIFKEDKREERKRLEELIVKDCTENKISLHEVMSKYHICNGTTHKILERHNIKVGEQGKHEYSAPKNLHKTEDGFEWKAFCKHDDYVTYDVDNRGGFLGKHLRDIGIEVPSLYARKKIAEEQNLDNWFELHYEFKKLPIKKEEVKKCPYCGWQTIDINNLAGSFKLHLKRAHNMSVYDHIKIHPEDAHYLKLDLNTLKNLQFEEDEDKFVVCQICGKKLRRIDWRHLEKHGITQEEYVLKYGEDSLLAKETKAKLSAIAIENNKHMEVNFTSKGEVEVLGFIKSLGFNASKDRKLLDGKELDIVIPELKIAFEFNGVLWHTEKYGGKDKMYHLSKTLQCEENGFQLYHIFEDEYNLKKEILFEKIKEYLGLPFTETINLSDIKYESVSNDEKENMESIKKFVENNSLDLLKEANFYYVGKDNNEIVSVITVNCISVKDRKYEIENLFYKLNSNYKEVFRNLLANFINEYNPKIIDAYANRLSYSDLRDNIYNSNGFKHIEDVEPEPFYFSRSGVFRNKKVLLENIIENKVNVSDYDKIWNCGYLKYRLTL